MGTCTRPRLWVVGLSHEQLRRYSSKTHVGLCFSIFSLRIIFPSSWQSEVRRTFHSSSLDCIKELSPLSGCVRMCGGGIHVNNRSMYRATLNTCTQDSVVTSTTQIQAFKCSVESTLKVFLQCQLLSYPYNITSTTCRYMQRVTFISYSSHQFEQCLQEGLGVEGSVCVVVSQHRGGGGRTLGHHTHSPLQTGQWNWRGCTRLHLVKTAITHNSAMPLFTSHNTLISSLEESLVYTGPHLSTTTVYKNTYLIQTPLYIIIS